VQAVCERIIIINHGRIIANARTDELTRAIERSAIYEYVIAGPAKDVAVALRSVPGVAGVESAPGREADAAAYHIETVKGADVRRSVFRLCAERSWPILGLSTVGNDLESIFIRLVDDADGISSKKSKKNR
jgi:ABC-2 type transport system ATP-binding protein